MGLVIYFLFGVLLQRIGIFWWGYTSFESSVVAALIVIGIFVFDILVIIIKQNPNNDPKPPHV